MSPRLTVGVMGQSTLPENEVDKERLLELGETLGRSIAKVGAVILTGATTGLPHAAALAAQAAGGISIGISPAKDSTEHLQYYRLPTEGFDSIIFTGLA